MAIMECGCISRRWVDYPLFQAVAAVWVAGLQGKAVIRW